ncbi:hypothetical protein EYR38_003352 [Pleurotus pulmonarius]|nr:hypothetical protein EYR38_003352 [Pleurotus pulmonarius]
MAKARSIYQFVAWNFVQNVGISGGISLGAGTIGDIFKLEDRGFAMGLFYGASLLGLAIAPVIGALRLPETSHPGTLGVEKADNQEQHAQADGVSRQRQKRRWVWLNPFSCLGLLRSPNLMLVALADTSVLLMDFVLSVPLRNTIGAKYGITNEALIGAILIPCGVGNTVGALLAGYISDRIIITYRAKRGGEWYPEDRLRGTLFSAATLVPLAVLFTGLTVEYVPGRTGLLLCLVWLFMNGVGIRLVLSPSEAYNVDVVHARSSEIIAASTATRTLLVSILVPGILPSIDHFGIVVTNMAAALIVWAGLGLLMVTIRYGKQLRSWMDVGFSTVEDN